MLVGDITVWERTFTEEDVQLFAQISGDRGIHHMEPDEQGRLVVQGLLTATLPTKLGGDMSRVRGQYIQVTPFVVRSPSHNLKKWRAIQKWPQTGYAITRKAKKY